MIRKLIATLVGSLLVASALSAQEPNIQRVSFFTFRAPSFPAKIFLRSGPEKFTEVELQGANTTSYYNVLNVGGSIALHGEPVVNEEGVSEYPVIGRLKSNPGWKRVFGVLNGVVQDGKIVYRGRSFEMSKRDFPDGSIKFANLSERPIRGLLGNQKVFFKPREIGTINMRRQKEGQLIDVVFQYKSPQSDKWTRMVSTRWAVKDEGRSLLLAFEDPVSKRMSTRTIPLREEARQ
jgi:hypothetical protein